MPINDPTERLAILRTDLEQWMATFKWVHGHLMALDLSENYREGRPDKQYSRLTRLAATAHDKLEGYLDVSADESLSDE